MDRGEREQHQQRAMMAAEQVKNCISKTAKRKMAQQCLRELRLSLATTP